MPPTRSRRERHAPACSRRLHNDGFELTEVGGTRTCDLLLGLVDPKLVT